MNKQLNITQIKQEVSREELIKVFDILYAKKLINQSELQHAISLANERYKAISQIKI